MTASASVLESTSMAMDKYVKLVRRFLQDYAPKNYLQPDTEEFSNDVLEQSILMALEIYNSCTGHLSNDSIEKFPVPTLLVIGGAGYAMFSGGVLQARNHFSVSDGNTSGPVSEKTELYRSWGHELISMFTALAAKHKESKNMEEAYRHFGSNYLLNYFYKDDLTTI